MGQGLLQTCFCNEFEACQRDICRAHATKFPDDKIVLCTACVPEFDSFKVFKILIYFSIAFLGLIALGVLAVFISTLTFSQRADYHDLDLSISAEDAELLQESYRLNASIPKNVTIEDYYNTMTKNGTLDLPDVVTSSVENEEKEIRNEGKNKETEINKTQNDIKLKKVENIPPGKKKWEVDITFLQSVANRVANGTKKKGTGNKKTSTISTTSVV